MTTEQPKTGFLLGNSTYDVLRNIVQYWVPGLGTFYFTLAQIWNLPFGEEVVGSLAAAGIFFGVVLGISKKTYVNSDVAYDGGLVIDNAGEKDIFRLEIDSFDGLSAKDAITLKVKQNPGGLTSLNGDDLSQE